MEVPRGSSKPELGKSRKTASSRRPPGRACLNRFVFHFSETTTTKPRFFPLRHQLVCAEARLARAPAPEPRSAARTFAVNGDGALRVLADVQEPPHDGVAGGAAVDEEEVVVLEAGVREALRLVDLLVQPHDGRHIMLFEIREVGFGGVKRIT